MSQHPIVENVARRHLVRCSMSAIFLLQSQFGKKNVCRRFWRLTESFAEAIAEAIAEA
jgi:hypothetical protein